MVYQFVIYFLSPGILDMFTFSVAWLRKTLTMSVTFAGQKASNHILTHLRVGEFDPTNAPQFCSWLFLNPTFFIIPFLWYATRYKYFTVSLIVWELAYFLEIFEFFAEIFIWLYSLNNAGVLLFRPHKRNFLFPVLRRLRKWCARAFFIFIFYFFYKVILRFVRQK